jgi:hypothetical protein
VLRFSIAQTSHGFAHAAALNLWFVLARFPNTAKPKPNMPQGATLLARARGVLDDAV